MIGYVTIGALNQEASGKFYDAVLGALGGGRVFTNERWIGYGPKGSQFPEILVGAPHDEKPASSGNGMMVSLRGEGPDQIRAAYQAGLKNGGADEGEPGPRPPDSTSFFGAYLRDPTGNKICIFCTAG